MDLRYSEEQLLIGQQARSFFEKDCPLEVVRRCWARETELPEALWQRMAELGWLGAAIEERFGGQGLSYTDLSRILEEMGRGLLPGSFMGTLFGTLALQFAGNDAQRKALLPQVAAGRMKLALARSLEGGRFDELGGRFYADEEQDSYLLFGEKLAVPAAAEADRIVVAAVLGLPERLDEGIAFFLIDPHAAGVQVHPLDSLEGGLKQASLRLTGVRVAPEQRLAGAGAAPALGRLEAAIDMALAFDALGGAQRLMEMAVQYAGMRTAFDQPIGAFQAVKHKCADMLYAVENLRAAAIWAAWVLDVPESESGTSAALATAIARAAAIEAYDVVTRHATQVQGAIAVTEEHDTQLFAKRGKTLALAFGNLSHHYETILRHHDIAVPGTEPLHGNSDGK